MMDFSKLSNLVNCNCNCHSMTSMSCTFKLLRGGGYELFPLLLKSASFAKFDDKSLCFTFGPLHFRWRFDRLLSRFRSRFLNELLKAFICNREQLKFTLLVLSTMGSRVTIRNMTNAFFFGLSSIKG